MVTSAKHIFQFQEAEVGYICKEGPAPVCGQRWWIYVPRLMPRISLSEAWIPPIPVGSGGNSVLANGGGCRFGVMSVIMMKNYVFIPYEYNHGWYPHQLKPINIVRFGVQVMVNCKSSQVSEMTFLNDRK